MGSEIVRIGSLEVSKSILEVVFPLLGVVIGGLVTYLVTSAAERQRWRQAKQDRLAEAQRGGISIALKWLDPMDRAISRANLLLSTHLHGEMEHEEFMVRWPRLLDELTEHDIPKELRVLLPDGLYIRGNRIVRKLDEVRTLAVRFGKTPFRGLQECGAKLDAIAAEVKQLDQELAEMYRETYR